jgi:hypothetical protein
MYWDVAIASLSQAQCVLSFVSFLFRTEGCVCGNFSALTRVGQFRKSWDNGTMSTALELPLLVGSGGSFFFFFEKLSYVFKAIVLVSDKSQA